MNELTQDLLKELFDYRDGELYWAVSRKKINVGDRAGNIRNDGYREMGINGKSYKTHRLIFLYHHGYLPKILDHIDGDKLNNNITNLREATVAQNQQNQKKRKYRRGKLTTSKYKGVSWDERYKKWHTQITIDGKQQHLGYFASEIIAAKIYDTVATKHFGNFANLNLSEEI